MSSIVLIDMANPDTELNAGKPYPQALRESVGALRHRMSGGSYERAPMLLGSSTMATATATDASSRRDRDVRRSDY